MDNFIVITLILLLFILIIFTIMLIFNSIELNDCKYKYFKLEKKYDDDIKPKDEAVKELNVKNDDLRLKNDKYENRLREISNFNDTLQKNVIGIFNNNYILSDKPDSCVDIVSERKGDISYLDLNLNCIDPNKYKIFNYEPINRQLYINLGNEQKCVEAFNTTDVILNDCSKTSQRQKFNYYPMYDGSFKSMLYSKCLGYNPETKIIELQKCNDSTNIRIKEQQRKEHLFLENK